MIGRLSGQVIDEEAIGTVLLDVGGVGYELHCPVGTVGRARAEKGDATSSTVLYVHTNVRQDALELFGFCSLEERAAFRHLTSVPGVGPRLAIAVLNVLPASELFHAVDAEDKARMVKIPGVGKKTAERLIIELRGKLSPGKLHSPKASPERSAPQGEMPVRLVAALTGLGYRSAEAERAAKAVLVSGRETDLSLLLREALDYLAP